MAIRHIHDLYFSQIYQIGKRHVTLREFADKSESYRSSHHQLAQYTEHTNIIIIFNDAPPFRMQWFLSARLDILTYYWLRIYTWVGVFPLSLHATET